MDDQELASRLATVLKAEAISGCPVAGHDDEERQEIAVAAMRRWRSLTRRSGTSRPGHP